MENKQGTISNITPLDYHSIIFNLDEWWGGRHMTPMLPRLFFNHFSDTSFIIKEGSNITGFIIGFLSQANSRVAYVHFVGVHPRFRKQGVGRKLYQRFFEEVSRRGVKEVECVTSPINETSIRFHQKLGFTPKFGNDVNENGVPFTCDYDGPGENMVVFTIQLPDVAKTDNP